MKQHLTLITGASRGLGLAMCEQVLAQGHCVVAIARKRTELPVPPGATLLSWEQDLSQPLAAARRLEEWLVTAGAARRASATLINNAGADAVLFPERERFMALKAAGQLDSPAQAAAKVLAFLARADFGNEPVADVRAP